jgi:RNA polymerase sigma-70 factor (ECF subfamily)
METQAVAIAVGGMSTTEPALYDLEAVMVQRAQGGDAAAFRWLFDRDIAGVRRFLFDLLRDRDAADEAAQETFVRAHRGLGSLREVTRWRSWLFGTARRVFLEQLRVRKRAPKASIDDEKHQPVDRAANPEQVLIGREADRIIESALDKLSDERRAALVLRLDHRLDYDAIGEAMGWPLSKVKNEIHRARLELRAYVGNYGEA